MSVIESFPKSDKYEIIEKGELVEISYDNKMKKSSSPRSRLIIGVASDNYEHKYEKPTYILNGKDINQEIQDNINVIVSGVALVKISGHVNVGDLLISSEEPGKAKAIRYNEDKENIGTIIGKVIQYTSKENEVIAIISLS